MRLSKARHYQSGYMMPLREINHVVIPMMFDTGAVNTAISLPTYYRGKADLEELERRLVQYCPYKEFHAASGTLVGGYLVYVDHVSIAGISVDRFYYYLLLGLQFNTALLGDDFIKNCVFRHDLHGDIEIQHFDGTTYRSEMAASIGQAELNRLLELN